MTTWVRRMRTSPIRVGLERFRDEEAGVDECSRVDHANRSANPVHVVRTAYGDEKYERLVALKDPENLFRMNQNIEPSRRPAEPALT